MRSRIPRGTLMLWPAPVPRLEQFDTRHDWTQVAQAWERLQYAYAHAYGSRHVPAPPGVQPPLPPSSSSSLRTQLEGWVGWHNRQITQLGGSPVSAWEPTILGGGDDLEILLEAFGLPGAGTSPQESPAQPASGSLALVMLAIVGSLMFI